MKAHEKRPKILSVLQSYEYLSRPGWQPDKAEGLKESIIARLDHLCSVFKEASKQRLTDLLEL